MFKKNDPLIDSVKSVMKVSEIDRQIEAAVNEEFGVTSKNSLPHELKPAYEEMIAEVKKCMEEGGAEGSIPKTPREKDLAKKHGNPNRITKGDVLKARGVVEEDNLDEKWHEEAKYAPGKKPLTTPAKGAKPAIEEEEQLDELSKNTLRKYLVQTNWIKKDPGLMHDDRVAVGKKYAPGRKLASKKLRQKLYKTSKAGKEERKRKILDINEQQLDEKAESKAQRRFFGLVRDIQKGEAHGSEKAEKAAKEMSVKSVRDYAKTKEAGLPEKVEKKEIKESFEQFLKNRFLKG